MLRSLQTLPVRKVSKRNAYLHLWTLPESLVVALQVLRAWGFRYQTHLLRTKAPADYGRYWRPSHELLLLGVRGTLAFRDNSLLSCDDEQFSSPAEKSASTRHLIERASPGPYLELFGSGSAPGWAFGRSSSKTIMTQMV
jgi:N6-adenosine-specific RNA methylase IME4